METFAEFAARVVDDDLTENDYDHEPWFSRVRESLANGLWAVGYLIQLALASKRG